MNNHIIEVNNLSKQYHLGAKERTNRTLREAVTDALTAPVRNFRNLRRLTRIEDDNPDTIWALKNISFQVQPGEVVGIIGRNGAGKSTLLKILSRITEPTSGEIMLHGRVSSLLEVGTGFHPELTGRENIYLNGTILGMHKVEIDRKFDEIVAFSEIEKFLDTPVKRYSSGMYVRLAFAVAAHLEPEILLIDEVLAVGDSEFQKKCLGKMGTVAKEGRTVLFVSHNMAAVSNICPRSLLLSHGSIIQNGPTEEVIIQYLSQVSETARIPLADRKDRQGEGCIRFTDTWIEDEQGNRLSSAASGRPLKILASYITDDACRIQNLKVSFALSTISNIAITDLSNVITGDLFLHDIPAKGIFSCFIPKLPLNAGTYAYNVFAMTSSGIQDWIQHAGTFTVENGDYFGTGNIPDRSRLMFIDHSWSIHPKK
jgi:lipopolysaccharide transport system ATP-binding protein